MHVVIVPSWYFPIHSNEIMGRMFHTHAAALRKEDIDARIVYGSYSRRDPLFPVNFWEEELGVPTWRTSRWFLPKINPIIFRCWIRIYARTLLHYIKKHGRPDLLHAQSYQAAAVCAYLHRTSDIPFVYTERLSNVITQNIPRWYAPFLREIFDRASLITCVSPGMLDYMSPHTQKNIRVVPNFFDDSIFYLDENIGKNKIFTFISVGEPAHTKGLDLLLQAFAIVKNSVPDLPMQLILADRIAEKNKLMELAASLGIGANIVWQGLLSQQALASLMNQCHVLVSASRVETFGKTMIEAQACGLPIVATKTAGGNFILTKSQQGELTEINNPEALAKSMGRIMTGYANFDAQWISKNISARFSTSKIIPQWVSIYKSIIH